MQNRDHWQYKTRMLQKIMIMCVSQSFCLHGNNKRFWVRTLSSVAMHPDFAFRRAGELTFVW